MVTDPDNDFLCPIILSMDKTTISNLGLLSVYAIMFTSSIFDLKVSRLNNIDFSDIFQPVLLLDPESTSGLEASRIYSY